MQFLAVLYADVFFDDPGEGVDPERSLVFGGREEVEAPVAALDGEFEGPALADQVALEL